MTWLPYLAAVAIVAGLLYTIERIGHAIALMETARDAQEGDNDPA